MFLAAMVVNLVETVQEEELVIIRLDYVSAIRTSMEEDASINT